MLKRTPTAILNKFDRPPKPVTRRMQAKWSVAKSCWRFYFNVRTEESNQPGCPESVTLGEDLEQAQRRVDEELQPALEAWRLGKVAATPVAEYGSLYWLLGAFFESRFFLGEVGAPGAAPVDPETGKQVPQTKHQNRKWHLTTFANFKLEDGRPVGALQVTQFTPALREALLKAFLNVVDTDKKTGKKILRQRRRTRNRMFKYLRAMWNHMAPIYEPLFPKTNPWANMGLQEDSGDFPAATHEELERFVAAADRLGHPSVGNAAMVGWEWAQRKLSILASLDAGDYRPVNARSYVYVEHDKNTEYVWICLNHHKDKKPLFPELQERLDRAKMYRETGPLIFRDHIYRETGKIVPWVSDKGSASAFDKVVGEIKKAANLRDELSFGSFRQGGLTEMGEAELTDNEIRHLSRHKSARVLRRYLKLTAKLISKAQRKRRIHREDTSADGEDLIILKRLPTRVKTGAR
jgi:hypothetical protein